jgi:hypothetical protein
MCAEMLSLPSHHEIHFYMFFAVALENADKSIR